MKRIKKFGVDFNETKLKNGVKLCSFYKPNSPIYFRVYFYAGSQFDGDKPGLAHFCEHMMVSGTEKYPTKDLLNKIFDEIGARKNAFTSQQNLWFTVDLSDKADLPEMFEIVDQILNKSIFASDIIEKERGAILAEQTRKISNPAMHINDLKNSLLFQGTNIENPVLGFDKSVKNISRDDLLDYRDKYLTNGQIAYFIAGDFDEKIVIDSLNKINNFHKHIELSKEELPVINTEKELIKAISNSEQNYLSVFCRVIPLKDKLEIISGDIFNVIFGQGSTSRLNKALRYDRGLVYDVSAGVFGNPEYASFSANTSCKVKDSKDVIEVIKFELSRIIEEGINPEELERAKKNILRNLKFNSEKADFWVDFGSMKEITSYLEPILPDEYIDILKSVTVEDVNLFIKKYLPNKELLLAGIGNFSFIEK